ncbi:MAG: cyclic nucleotide-binding domain-containing protein [Roseiarcus sp.]
MDPFSRDRPRGDEHVELLRQLEFFRSVDHSALHTLVGASRPVSLRRGRALFAEGEPARSGFALVEGRLRLDSAAAGAATRVSAPAFIGESALIIETTRRATAIAEVDSSLIEITRQTFLRVLAEFPESAVRLRRLIAERLQRTLDDLESARENLDALPLSWNEAARSVEP